MAKHNGLIGSRLWQGHAPGLAVLFFTEMWERFSYYGMRALLVLYLSSYLMPQAQQGLNVYGFTALRSGLESLFGPLSAQALVSHIYGLYSGLVYLTPLLGGLLADVYLGRRRTVFLGGCLMMCGHFLMAFSAWLLPAMLLLILGNGCFKPNISTQVGGLYALDDPRRDSAFTLFYMGINLGAFFSPLICGSLGQQLGWHYGFAAAGVGMFIGLLVYASGQKYLPQAPTLTPGSKQTIYPKPALSGDDWHSIAGLLVLALLNIVFWAVYEQQGNSLQLFVDQRAERVFFGWEMPSTWFQALNPLLILFLGPLVALSGQRFSSVLKMVAGYVLLGLAFMLLGFAVSGIDETSKINFSWLAACCLLYTLGELLVSPVGLSLVSKTAPQAWLGLLMGVWFLSTFFGNLLSGYIGAWYQQMGAQAFFMLLASLVFAVAVLILGLRRRLERAVGHP